MEDIVGLVHFPCYQRKLAIVICRVDEKLKVTKELFELIMMQDTRKVDEIFNKINLF